jgi:hypothetical protein
MHFEKEQLEVIHSYIAYRHSCTILSFTLVEKTCTFSRLLNYVNSLNFLCRITITKTEGLTVLYCVKEISKNMFCTGEPGRKKTIRASLPVLLLWVPWSIVHPPFRHCDIMTYMIRQCQPCPAATMQHHISYTIRPQIFHPRTFCWSPIFAHCNVSSLTRHLVCDNYTYLTTELHQHKVLLGVCPHLTQRNPGDCQACPTEHHWLILGWSFVGCAWPYRELG